MPLAEDRPAGAVRLDLALVGFGNVGRRFARLVDEQRERLARDHALTIRVVGIGTAQHGAAFDGNGLDVARALALVESGARLDELHDCRSGLQPASGVELIERHARHVADPAAPRVVVETTTLDVASAQPAIDHVRAALAAGAHVVTANKGPVALAYRELAALAESAGRAFLFEGAVMDGVPVFNLVRDTLPAVTVFGFRGIVNTTTNHILAEMERGRRFEDALAEMQAAGTAEADPSLDIEGWDAAAKTAALVNVLMGGDTTPRQIDRTGIGPHLADAVRAAVARGRRLRLVAEAERSGSSVCARVAPTELPATDLLAGLSGQANALILRTDLLGEIAIVQMGSSLTQTAYALVSDLVEVGRRLRGPA